ncbi:MAG: amidohydrolase family protein [Bacteroidia bacterium]|nr:amidohydrolase family protein [Bacteroidia bacterium]
MSKLIKINGHGHILPEPGQIPAFMREKKVFWIDEDRKFMRQGDWKRPVTDPSFFLAEKLAWMERNEIIHGVMLNLSQLYCNGMERGLCRDVIRFQNDFNAGIQADYPEKFTCGFVVQPLHLDDALLEMERCVNELKLNLLCLPTHFLDAQGKWKTVASPEVEPIWQMANEMGLAVEIHPYDGPRMIQLEDEYWRFHLVWMCAQTADTYHFFTLRDFPGKFPRVRTCFAHGNQFGQVNVGRRVQGFEGRPDLFEGAKHPLESLKAPNVWFDTLVHDVLSLRLLLDRQGAASILAGLDDPYPLGEMETVPGCYPGKVIDEAVTAGFIDGATRQKIWYDNVINWLVGDQREEFVRRIGV